MSWKESCQMDERVKFISMYLDGEKIADLCRKFEISRKTAHKFINRYKNSGLQGLSNQKRGPNNVPHKTASQIELLILKLRSDKPTWGPKKIKVRLENLYRELKFPAASTIGEILKRNEMVKGRKKRLRKYDSSENPNIKSKSPNDVWCIDFKGQFRLGSGKYCYPLTITDHYSRYILGCEGLESTKLEGVIPVFEDIFSEYGLPKIILSDNGTPFASNGIRRLSRLSVWFLRLGITPMQIEPGKPQQNGRHERMHLTLKKETTRPPGKNLINQQEKFYNFIDEFNHERPHEAIQMKTPGKLYLKSKKKYKNNLPIFDYSLCDQVRKVSCHGVFRLPTKNKDFCFLGRALSGEYIGLVEIKEDKWKIYFLDNYLGETNFINNRYVISI
jgi:transposase InsO family protein